MIYNVGSINIDHVYRVPHLVRPGETLTGHNYRQILGGKGANQTIAIARAGGQVRHIGAIGHQDSWILQVLAATGADTDTIRQCPDLLSGHAVIQVDDDSENAIVLYPGANGEMPFEAISEPLSQTQPGEWLLMQNECAHLESTLRLAREKGLKIAFNPAPMTANVAKLKLDDVSLLFVNEGEALDLVALKEHVPLSEITHACTSPEQLMNRLRRHYPRTACVLTLGAKGAMYSNGTTHITRKAYRVKALDTTAAGDTFVGYFMAATLRDASPQQALDEAIAAAALCVQKEGASSSIPDHSEVVALYQSR